MDDTKWSETLLCPKCGSDDTDIGWTSGDGKKVTEKIYTDIPIAFPHDKETMGTILKLILPAIRLNRVSNTSEGG